jgi:hypothetical protein
MCAAWDSSSVHLPDFVRTTTFRWTLAIASAFVLCSLVLFGFVYWETAAYMTSTFDDLIVGELNIIAADSPSQRLEHIKNRLRDDPRRVRIAGLFGADGHRIAGNIESLPPGLTPGIQTNAVVVRDDDRGRETEKVRLVTDTLSGGEILVIGRNVEDIAEIADIVRRALALSNGSRRSTGESNVSSRGTCARACQPVTATIRLISSPSASTGCWTKLKPLSRRLPASATTSPTTCARR